jgi:hypothetical protein
MINKISEEKMYCPICDKEHIVPLMENTEAEYNVKCKNGNIITDRATVSNSINISNNLTLKSDSTRTISGFTTISTSSVYTPFVSCSEMYFYNDFGLTISGELLMSTTTPLKIGSWNFPSAKPPQFTTLSVDRAKIPNAPNNADFDKIINSNWRYNSSTLETPQQNTTITNEI